MILKFLSIYIFPVDSNIMDISIKLIIGLFLTVALGLTMVQLAAGQPVTHSTQPLIVVQQPTQVTEQQVEGVVKQADNNSIIGAIATVGTIATGLFTLYLKKEDKKVKEQSYEGHEQNEFRLEAATEAVKEMNNSIKATDACNLEFAKIIQVLFKPFKEHETVRKAYEKYTVDGIPVLEKLDQFVAQSQSDLEEYYNGENEKEDKFDTCNDFIVQKLALVRNKSKK